MKLKKQLFKLITATIVLVGIVSITNMSQATIDPTGKLLRLDNPTYRNSGYSYKAGLRSTSGIKELNMWKIFEYNTNGTTIKNKNNGLYCLKMGVGFGSEGGSATQSRLYTIYADMKNPSTSDQSIIDAYKSILPNSNTENYNSLIWVLDHCYVPAPEKSPTDEEISIANNFKQQLLTDAGIPYSIINDDLIDIAQQIAIWYFTNDDQYKVNKENGITSIHAKLASDFGYDAIENIFNDWDLPTDVQMLTKYLIQGGENNKYTIPNSNNTNPIILLSGSAKTQESNGKYISGPYNIYQTTDDSYYLEGKLTDVYNNNIPYVLLDSNKQPTTKTLKELVGQDFYLLTSSASYMENAKFKITSTVMKNNITLWMVAGSSVDQPIAEIVPTKQNYSVETYLTVSKFDLALRKFITKINDVEVSISREPQISTQTLQELANKTRTTTTKTHTKDPLKVEIGDTVLYTIRVYNEGELDGYAKEITDYLPQGLTLKPGSTININNGWTNPSGDGKTIVTTKLASTLLRKFNGANLDYQDIEIECIVNANASTIEQRLKNVAEITKDADENGNEIDDVDSIPQSLTVEQKNNYNPGTSTQGWGYQDDDDYEELLIPGKVFDLALRKFITNINGKELKDSEGKYTREPDIDLTPLINKTGTTALYKHQKDPIGVSVGDIVIYTLRIYNEGDLDGYASKVTDYLPEQLEFVMDDQENFNAKYGWQIDSSLRKASTNYLDKQVIDPEDTLLKAFDGTNLDYQELKIKCRVKSTSDLNKIITNIAEITTFIDSQGNVIVDRDSQSNNINLPNDNNLPDYKGNESNKSILNDKEYFYKGQQDDDDFEKLILEKFDLALRKFITKVNDTSITTRIPVFTNVKDQNGNYIYEHTKEPVEVNSTDIVEYTIRIFNEGDISGYAKEIKDDIPSGLEFLPDDAQNKEYRWIMLDENENETTDVLKAKYITTDYLSKEQEESLGSNLIKYFSSTKTSPDYKDVKAKFKVVALDTYTGIITNIAQISDDSDEEGKDVDDVDSTPNNDIMTEDDIDVEHLKLSYFDLALRKFITKVNDTDITTRVPKFKIDENGKYVYEHTKEPVEVENGNIITYAIRVFNEGTKSGYAKEVKDDLPEGLEFLPENETNKEYRWIMIDEAGKETTDIKEAVSIKTDYLSKEQGEASSRDNLLKKFDTNTMESPDYKDLKIAFKVTEPNTSDRILINKAQISNDSDENGNDVVDIDSTPDKWIEEDDDQDIEKVKVKYFDLALRKWVTQAIIIDDGKEEVIETGHKAEDDPEEVVKVEIKEGRINKVVVKFLYKIRITNEGEIAGYATEISDYIPEGLEFVEVDNPGWKEVDGKIVTDLLKDTLLQPGETAEIEVLLTWVNGKENFGLKVNIAEISKDKNDSNTPDIDSTPNNLKEGEDDIDDAPVILSIKTGAGLNGEYVGLSIITLTILSAGAILIKKYVL